MNWEWNINLDSLVADFMLFIFLQLVISTHCSKTNVGPQSSKIHSIIHEIKLGTYALYCNPYILNSVFPEIETNH